MLRPEKIIFVWKHQHHFDLISNRNIISLVCCRFQKGYATTFVREDTFLQGGLLSPRMGGGCSAFNILVPQEGPKPRPTQGWALAVHCCVQRQLNQQTPDMFLEAELYAPSNSFLCEELQTVSPFSTRPGR